MALLLPLGAQTLTSRHFESGSIAVNNEESAQFTVVTIAEGRERTAALLDVASAMTGVGCVIHEAIIQARLPCAHTSWPVRSLGRVTWQGPRLSLGANEEQVRSHHPGALPCAHIFAWGRG